MKVFALVVALSAFAGPAALAAIPYCGGNTHLCVTDTDELGCCQNNWSAKDSTQSSEDSNGVVQIDRTSLQKILDSSDANKSLVPAPVLAHLPPPQPICSTYSGVQNYGNGCTATYIYYICSGQVERCTQINSGCGAYNYDGPCGG